MEGRSASRKRRRRSVWFRVIAGGIVVAGLLAAFGRGWGFSPFAPSDILDWESPAANPPLVVVRARKLEIEPGVVTIHLGAASLGAGPTPVAVTASLRVSAKAEDLPALAARQRTATAWNVDVARGKGRMLKARFDGMDPVELAAWAGGTGWVYVFGSLEHDGVSRPICIALRAAKPGPLVPGEQEFVASSCVPRPNG